ncbi:MAG: hypothetical protein AB7V16_09770 [Vulcanibacillus sp.]
MNINEMLIYADIEHISKIAEHYNCPCNRNSKADTIQSIIYHIFQKDILQESIEQLDDIEYTFIQLLYLDSRMKYSIEDLIAKGKQAIDIHNSVAKPKDLILQAVKKGWIFSGVGKKYLFVYLIPQDFKDKILKVVYKNLIKNIKHKEYVNFYRDESKFMKSDLFSFLKYIKKEKVLLTNEGNIYKKQQKIIFQSFQIQEELIKKTAWRFGYGRRYKEYPDRFSLIYDYAYYNKFILEDELGFLTITTKGENYLNCNSLVNDEIKIYKFWIRVYKYSIPYILIILNTIDLIAYNNWIELNSLEAHILFWLKDHFYEGKQQVFRERIIKILMHLGAIQVSCDENFTYIRVTSKGHNWINGLE